MRKSFFGLFILVTAFLSNVTGQRLVSSAANGTMPVASVNSRIAKVFGQYAVDSTNSPIVLQKVVYTSRDEKGRIVNLTGLVAWPRDGAPKGLVIFNHGTMADRAMNPSRYKGAANDHETETATLAFASGGYAVIMPDYLGSGDHQAAHPYPLNITNSRAGIDMIVPARSLARRQNYGIGPKLFVTGYSEGGGVAMAQLRELERMTGPDYRVESAAPASGPYDLSGVTREFMLQEGTDLTEFGVRLYLLSYMANYFQKSSGVKLTQVFKPSMAFTVDQAYKTNRKDEDIVKRLVLAATLMRAKNSLANVVTSSFYRAMETADMRDPIVAALKANDIYDWSPKTRMLLINLEDDAVVDPRNTEKAFRTMRNRGIGANMLRRYVIPGGSLTHLTAFPAALATARRFFDGGFPAVREAQ